MTTNFDGAHRSFNPDAEYVLDWRGNSYRLYEPLGESCQFPECTAEAVRLACNCRVRTGMSRRPATHWHGSIHDVEHNLWKMCRQHGTEALARTRP